MTILIWAGVVLSILGLCGVIYSVVAVVRAKRAKLDDAALRARIARMMPVNMGAFMAATLGLMMVVVGILLG